MISDATHPREVQNLQFMYYLLNHAPSKRFILLPHDYKTATPFSERYRAAPLSSTTGTSGTLYFTVTAFTAAY